MVVEHCESLQRGVGGRTNRGHRAAIGAIKSVNQRIGHGSKKETVNGASTRCGRVRIEVFVIEKRGSSIRVKRGLVFVDELNRGRPTHFQIKLSAERQHRVAQLFGAEANAILTPQEAVVSVDGHALIRERGLFPCLTRQDELMESFERAFGLVTKPDRQPIQQFRMAWKAAHFSEVIWCLHQPASEMEMPDAIHNTAPSQNITIVCEPIGKSGPAS